MLHGARKQADELAKAASLKEDSGETSQGPAAMEDRKGTEKRNFLA